MITLGMVMLAGVLAQSGAPMTADYANLEGQLVEIVFPEDVPLPAGWTEARRSGYLQKATPRPRFSGEYTLTIAWDEPWNNPSVETVNDTVRDSAGRMQKLVILPESENDRIERIKQGWTGRQFTLVGADPLDPRDWVSGDLVKLAEQSQQLVRANAPAVEDPAPENAAPAEATPAQTAPAPGMLAMRGPQILIGVCALAVAGLLVKMLVL